MDNKSDVSSFISASVGGHPGSIYSANQAGVVEAFNRFMREGRKNNAGDIKHQVIIGKSRDGMSGFTKSILRNSGASSATGLLSCLLRRI